MRLEFAVDSENCMFVFSFYHLNFQLPSLSRVLRTNPNVCEVKEFTLSQLHSVSFLTRTLIRLLIILSPHCLSSNKTLRIEHIKKIKIIQSGFFYYSTLPYLHIYAFWRIGA